MINRKQFYAAIRPVFGGKLTQSQVDGFEALLNEWEGKPSQHVTTISDNGVKLIQSFEGLRLKPYLDAAGIATIGYGSTRYENGTRVTMRDKAITAARADSLFRATLATYEQGVDAITRDDISQAQYEALVSFCYNLGVNALKSSTLLKKVNANPGDPAIRGEFLKWTHAAGKKLAGLTRRREAEADLYFS
jgi:lysozyme